jgi:hypothetical protein
MQGFRRIADGAMGLASSIYCVKCAANLTLCHDDLPDHTPEQLVEMVTKIWNTRAPDPRLAELRAIAEELNRPHAHDVNCSAFAGIGCNCGRNVATFKFTEWKARNPE